MPGIIKERLFTPGPTPLLMEAQARAMVANVHHRTEAFRQIMRETLDLLKYYFNTQSDVPDTGGALAQGRFRTVSLRITLSAQVPYRAPGIPDSTRSTGTQQYFSLICSI